MADVFVSYSRKDIDFVRTLVGALAERGKEVWVDWEGIPPTVEFMEEIHGAVQSADAFLFVLSPDSATSRVCNEELEGAVALNKRIIPVVRRDVPEADVPEEVAGLNWIFCRESDDLDQQVGVLVEALDTDYEWVRAHTRLLVRASEWERRGQESSLLLRGKDLIEAEEQVARPDRKPEPTELQHSFVLASKRASARSQRLRLVAVTVALVVALVLAGLALVQRQSAQEQRDEAQEQRQRAEEEATIARSRQLAAQADAQLDVDPELSTLLALESLDVGETDEAEDVLRDSITEANVVATLRGHDGPVDDVAVAERDGEPTVVTAGNDGTVRLWDPETGEQQDELEAHEGGVRAIDVSTEHGLLVTSGNGSVRVWDLASLERIAEIEAGVHDPSDVAIDPAGERLATAGSDGTVAIWDLESGEQTLTYRDHQVGPTPSQVRGVAWTPDGRSVVSAGADELVKVWDADTGATSLTYEDHPRLRVRGPITSLEVSPDGERVASSSGVETLIWAISDGQLITTVGRPGADAALAAFSPDGSELFTGGFDGVGRLWFTQSGVEEDRFLGHRSDLRAVAYSADGEHVVTSSADGTARVWATRAGDPLAPVRSATQVTYGYQGDQLARITIDADGTALLAAPDAPLSEGVDLDLDVAADAEVVGAAFSPDGSRLAMPFSTGEVVVLDTESGSVVAEHAPALVGPGTDPPPVEDFAFSPDGTRIASSTGFAQSAAGITPGFVEVWDVESGQPVAQIVPEGRPGQLEQVAPRLAWLDDETILTGGSSGEVHVWDAASGQESDDSYDEGAGEFVVDISVSADGDRVLSISQSGTARVWEAGSGDTLGTRTNRTTDQGAINGDGGLVATAGSDGAIEVWDAGSGEVLARYEQPDPPALLGFEPDGGSAFAAMTFSGRRLELVVPRRFECEQCGDLDDLVAFARDRVTREMTDEERERYLGG